MGPETESARPGWAGRENGGLMEGLIRFAWSEKCKITASFCPGTGAYGEHGANRTSRAALTGSSRLLRCTNEQRAVGDDGADVRLLVAAQPLPNRNAHI